MKRGIFRRRNAGGAQAWITAITAPSGFLSSQVMVPRLLKGQEVYEVQIRFIFYT
jgi:hypothetical protein